MSDEKKPLTGADVHLDANAKASIVNALAEKMRLRQWCVEQVAKILQNSEALWTIEGTKELTEYFFNFVTTTKENDHDKAA